VIVRLPDGEEVEYTGRSMQSYKIDGKSYVSTSLLSTESTFGGGLVITADRLEVKNECPTCHRGDIVQAKVHSWKEAVERGWLLEVVVDGD
jgi:hypothetical protein